MSNNNFSLNPYRINIEQIRRQYYMDFVSPVIEIMNINQEELLTEMFGDIFDREEMILQETLQESLSHYKTQERKPDIILDIPKYSLKKSDKGKLCCICQSELASKDKLSLLGCNHVLHTDCISEWVKYKAECPICRNPVNIKNENLNKDVQ